MRLVYEEREMSTKIFIAALFITGEQMDVQQQHGRWTSCGEQKSMLPCTCTASTPATMINVSMSSLSSLELAKDSPG